MSPGQSKEAANELFAGSCKSTMGMSLLLVAGGSPPRTVQGLLTRGRISGNVDRCSKVGCQVRPSGGPNSAQHCKRLAISVVVNLASTEAKAASGGVVKAILPNSTSILPWYLSY